MKKIMLLGLLTAFSLLLGTVSSYADTKYEYKCFSYYWNGDDHEKGTMLLEVTSKKATADILEVQWDENLGGDRDPDYNSRGAVKFVKFGYNLIVEKALLSGGKELRDGSLGGFARVEGEAEGGFYQYKFICKAK